MSCNIQHCFQRDHFNNDFTVKEPDDNVNVFPVIFTVFGRKMVTPFPEHKYVQASLWPLTSCKFHITSIIHWSCHSVNRRQDLNCAFKLLWILSCFTYWGDVLPPDTLFSCCTSPHPFHLPYPLYFFHLSCPLYTLITCYTPSYPYNTCNKGMHLHVVSSYVCCSARLDYPFSKHVSCVPGGTSNSMYMHGGRTTLRPARQGLPFISLQSQLSKLQFLPSHSNHYY